MQQKEREKERETEKRRRKRWNGRDVALSYVLRSLVGVFEYVAKKTRQRRALRLVRVSTVSEWPVWSSCIINDCSYSRLLCADIIF